MARLKYPLAVATVSACIVVGCVVHTSRTANERSASGDSEGPFFARFGEATAALSRGDYAEARAVASRLAGEYPGRSEGAVLQKLAERRESRPDESWLDSFSHAWREASMSPGELPRLEDGAFLGGAKRDLDVRQLRGKSGPAELLLAAVGQAGAYASIVNICVDDPVEDDPALELIRIALLPAECAIGDGAGQSELSSDRCAQAQAIRRRLLEDVARKERSIAVRLELALGDDSTLNTAARLAHIQRAAVGSRLLVQRTVLYERYRALYRQLGVEEPELLSAVFTRRRTLQR
jgi:hypothetical protein